MVGLPTYIQYGPRHGPASMYLVVHLTPDPHAFLLSHSPSHLTHLTGPTYPCIHASTCASTHSLDHPHCAWSLFREGHPAFRSHVWPRSLVVYQPWLKDVSILEHPLHCGLYLWVHFFGVRKWTPWLRRCGSKLQLGLVKVSSQVSCFTDLQSSFYGTKCLHRLSSVQPSQRCRLLGFLCVRRGIWPSVRGQ